MWCGLRHRNAGALVTPGKRLRSGFLYAGSPAKEVRPLSDGERQFLPYSAAGYVSLKDRYLGSPERAF